mmetsp:Transcript_21077/g.32566  ORF Transcript_21077/g.32566 Transcript_21077/m.32566 type:complete len:84 (-) Transcript_21077:36-287(-)
MSLGTRKILRHLQAKAWEASCRKLFEKITEDVDEEALEDVSFEQDVMNTIVAQMCLPHLSDAAKAKEACKKGHEMEPVYSKHR